MPSGRPRRHPAGAYSTHNAPGRPSSPAVGRTAMPVCARSPPVVRCAMRREVPRRRPGTWRPSSRASTKA